MRQSGLVWLGWSVVTYRRSYSSSETLESQTFSRRATDTKRPPTPSTRRTWESVPFDDPVAGSIEVVGAAVVVVVVGAAVVVVGQQLLCDLLSIGHKREVGGLIVRCLGGDFCAT